jgi:hypothetical protein
MLAINMALLAELWHHAQFGNFSRHEISGLGFNQSLKKTA